MEILTKFGWPAIVTTLISIGAAYATIKVTAAFRAEDNEKDHGRFKERLGEHDVEIKDLNKSVSKLQASMVKIFTLAEGIDKRLDEFSKRFDSFDGKIDGLSQWIKDLVGKT